MGKLEGRVAIVTGGASGIGAASVRLFVREGSKVVIADRDAEAGERLARELGSAALFQPTDVTSEEDVTRRAWTAPSRPSAASTACSATPASPAICGPSKRSPWRSTSV